MCQPTNRPTNLPTNPSMLCAAAALGAVSVTDLDSRDIALDASAAKALSGGSLQKAVVFVSSLLPDLKDKLLRVCNVLCLTTSQLTIACTLSEAAHCDELNYETEDNVPYYERISISLSQQIQRPSCKIFIKHCPLPAIFIGENAFVLSGMGGLAKFRGFHRPAFLQQSTDAPPMRQEALQDVSTEHGNNHHGNGIAVLAHTIAQVAASLNVRSTSAFCLGPESVAVGRALSFVPPVMAPHSAAAVGGAGDNSSPKPQQAAFVIVDRALDIVSPLLHGPLLLQKTLQVLHESEERSVLPPLTQALWLEDPGLVASSIFHPTDPYASANLSFLLSRSGNDAALFVRKWLREAARKEGIQLQHLKKPRERKSTAGSSIVEELKTLLSTLKAHYQLQFSQRAVWDTSLIQLADAIVKSLDAETSESLLLLAKAERALLLACTEGDVEAALYQLIDTFAATQKSTGPGSVSVSLSFCLAMLLLSYQILPTHMPWYAGGLNTSLTDVQSPFSPEQEIQLQEATMNAITQAAKQWAAGDPDDPQEQAEREAPWLSASLRSDLIAESSNEGGKFSQPLQLELRDAVENLIHTAKALSQSRSEFLTTKESSDETPVPLLVRLIDMMMSEKGVVKGLVHASTSLTGLLKSGLGRIGLQRQPRPKDYEVIVLFVVGGISLAEMHDVLARVDELQVNSNPDSPLPRVVIGGTCLLVPGTVPRMAFEDY